MNFCWRTTIGTIGEVAVHGKYDAANTATRAEKALRRWLQQTREMGVEPLGVERRSTEQTEAQKWRTQIAHPRSISAAKADEVFADPEYTRQFLDHLKNSRVLQLSHQWLRGKLSLLLRPELSVIDMGCGLNPFADLPCRVIGLDRHPPEFVGAIPVAQASRLWLPSYTKSISNTLFSPTGWKPGATQTKPAYVG